MHCNNPEGIIPKTYNLSYRNDKWLKLQKIFKNKIKKIITRIGLNLQVGINTIEYCSNTSYNKKYNEYLNAFFMKAATVTAQELLIHDI